MTAASGLATSGGSGAAAVGDYNNDGFLDLFVASANGGEPTLWLNKGNGTFTRDGRSSAAMQALRSTAGLAATFVDYDNDGWLDLVVGGGPVSRGGASPAEARSAGGTGSGAQLLFRNDGTGSFSIGRR